MTTTDSSYKQDTELSELFDTIRLQSTDYETVVDSLRTTVADVNEQREAVSYHLKKIRLESKAVLQKLVDNARTIERDIKGRETRIDEVYRELDAISTLKDELLHTQNAVNVNYDELNKAISLIDQTATNKIDDRFAMLEVTVAYKINTMTDRVSRFEDNLTRLNDNLRRTTEVLTHDIDAFRNKITDTSYLVDETIKIVEGMIHDADVRLNERFNNTSVQLDNKAVDVMNALMMNNITGQKVQMDLARLTRESADTRRNTQKMERKAMAAMIGTFVLSVLVVFLMVSQFTK